MTRHTVQVVNAAERGDSFYKGKSGWWWHELDSDCAVIVTTLRGPFASRELAMADAYFTFEAPRTCLLEDLHHSLHRGECCPECGHAWDDR